MISIHLMLLFNWKACKQQTAYHNFNTSNVTIQQKGRKYLEDCYRNFNTSNVTIQPTFWFASLILLLDFNTSNVTIQHRKHQTHRRYSRNFNTSNVTIQQFLLRTNWRCLHISIHLMLLFNYHVVPT